MRRSFVSLALTVALMLAGGAYGVPASAADGFYRASPDELHGRPGTLIRAEPIAAPPHAAGAYRILYRSTGLKGEPVAVSGVVAIPAAGAEANRPLVVWAHPTTGVARSCAPSLMDDVFDRVHGLADLLKQGYVVAAPDYPGLGTDGIHPYLIGPSEGRAVLDAARAAHALPGTGSGGRFIPWGFSQGGHAALWAGILAGTYAPDLKLVGIAAEAPPTELGTIIRADLGGRPGKVLSAYALWSWSRLYDIPVDTAIQERVALVLDRVSRDCSETFQQVLALGADSAPFEREGFLATDVTVIQPWRGLIEGNTPGITPPGVPVFIAQGGSDSIVQPLVTSLYRDELCSHKVPVRYVVEPGAEHADVPERSYRAAVEWIEARFAGAPAPDDCGTR